MREEEGITSGEKGLIQRTIYSPMILTIPDDAVFFSILNPQDKITAKIIMENYINYYCYKDLSSGLTFFRFEDYRHLGDIEGMEHCYVPIKILKRYHKDLGILFQLLESGFVILMPVHREGIEFYGKDAEGTHLMMVHGGDRSSQVFFCKDFSGHDFAEFQVSAEAMRKSLERYSCAELQETVGLLALGVREVTETIDYSKVFMEFSKLRQTCHTDRTGYGLGAMDLYLSEIKRYPRNSELIESWYVAANYLREGAKLMKIRSKVLEEEVEKVHAGRIEEHESKMHKLSHDADILFYNVCRLKKKNIIVSTEVEARLEELVYVCRQDFDEIAESFCAVISEFLLK